MEFLEQNLLSYFIYSSYEKNKKNIFKLFCLKQNYHCNNQK